MDTSKIRKSLKLAKRVKVWFWDTVREYTGEAVSLTAEDLTSLLKLGGTGMGTVIPNKTVMDGLIKHLTGRVVEFKISGQTMEVNLKGTITEIQTDFENARRLLVISRFQSTTERNQDILNHLGKNLSSPQ